MMMFGPSVLCFNVFESFMHYHEGIYNFVRGGPEEIHVYDHCVKLIGWGRYKNNSTDEMDSCLPTPKGLQHSSSQAEVQCPTLTMEALPA
uniref:Peptidase C1A papain C-terminal domain-containing protein n=1 Tax=Ditylenchus dipsaci TaxID=166011 RepID=A0A915ESH2_9BILA